MALQNAVAAAERIGRLLAGLAFLVLIAAVLIQVLGRWGTFFASPVWTEELTRFALLFLAAFGVGLSYRSGDLVNVDLVCESLPGRLPWLLRLLTAATTAGLCLLLVRPAWTFTSIGRLQTSPALGWRMDFIHASVLVLICSLLLFSLARVAAMLLAGADGLPESNREPAP